MKKLLFVCIALVAFVSTKAQGTLEFNQVLLLSSFANSNVSLGTVPAGKVWKVTGYGTEANGSSSCGFSFDGSHYAWNTGGIYNYGGSYTTDYGLSDFWIPAGVTLLPLWVAHTIVG